MIIRNKKFTSIGPLTRVPYCMDHEGDQVVSFLCLPSFPNCIVILLTSGIIYHSILIPNARYSLFESGNVSIYRYYLKNVSNHLLLIKNDFFKR